MKIPFLDRFKKEPESSPEAAAPHSAKADGASLSKTIMPSASRKSAGAAMEEFATPPPAMPSIAPAPPAMPAFAPPPPSPTPVAPRTISFSPKRTAGTNKADLPPAVALALEPTVERAVPFQLADVAAAMPAGLTKPMASIDKDRRILLKAADLERGMAARKPAVSLATLYGLVPDIFLEPVTAGDETEVELPFDLVLSAFSQMLVRRDQKSEQRVPQVSTPFLQATLEDNEKFGMPTETGEVSGEQPVPNDSLQLATAEALAAAEPEPSFQTPAGQAAPKSESAQHASISLGEGTQNGAGPSSKSTPERMPFSLPSKGTGEPASERVPASCGPPVSSPLPPPPEREGIPFAAVSSGEGATEESPLFDSAATDRKISLALKPILQSLPVFQLAGDPKEVSDDARIELPLPLIQTQLATGRVAVAPELFEGALPADCRRFFSADDISVPVILPLQEVLKNLPAASMRTRKDQQEDERVARFETPFAAPAEEDAERFHIPAEPIAHIVPPESEEEAQPPAPARLDAKSFIAKATQLAGVRACSLTFNDGLSLAGHLPTETGTEGLCAVAPSFAEKIGAQVAETKLGALQALTVHCEQTSITFFLQSNITLAVLHGQEELTQEVRSRLAALLEELVNNYSQPEVLHVHH